MQISDQNQLEIFSNNKKVHSSSEWEQEEQDAFAVFSKY